MKRLALLSLLLMSTAVNAEVYTSTPDTQKSLFVTVYNSNIGLIREVRALQIPSGEQSLKFMGVAEKINPKTVHIKSLTSPQALNVLEQNYEYDLLSPAKLLDKYVGKKLVLVLKQTDNGTEKLTPTDAVLLSNNEGAVWQIGNQIVINPVNIAEIRFPQLPESLIAKPTLIWQLSNENPASQNVEVSYLTDNLDWQADYVLLINAKDTQADLTGWVTIDNKSGTEYKNAQLQLVAGDVNRVDNQPVDILSNVAKRSMSDSAQQFQQENLFEYHLYTLQRPTTLKNNQTKQISLLEAQGISIHKLFTLSGQSGYYRGYNQPGVPIKEKVAVSIQLVNSQKNNLGQPLPAGIVRLYKSDSKGGQQFIGEDRIDHTPKDETVTVRVGEAFDIVAERKQTDYQALKNSTYEYAYEITLRNRKSEPITVTINEPINGDWDVISSSFKWEKTSAFAAKFTVPVAADGTAILSYRVRVKN